MKKCLDEGLIQCYLDGELSADEARDAAAHIAQCRACVEAMASARNESGLIVRVFAPEEYVDVPSERLRSRVNATISQLESATVQTGRETRLSSGGFLTALSGFFTQMPRHTVAFASLAVAACSLIFVLVQRPRLSLNEVAGNTNQAVAVSPQLTREPDEVRKPDVPPLTAIVQTGDGGESDNLPSLNGGNRLSRVRVEKAVYVSSRNIDTQKLLSSEKQYHETIASLNKRITSGGDALLKPTVRAGYERNLALLDDAIAETRGVALRNPNDKDAVNFLMSAYQSKVELLTTVANQAQVATLGR